MIAKVKTQTEIGCVNTQDKNKIKSLKNGCCRNQQRRFFNRFKHSKINMRICGLCVIAQQVRNFKRYARMEPFFLGDNQLKGQPTLG